jgi:hypothetical protein
VGITDSSREDVPGRKGMWQEKNNNNYNNERGTIRISFLLGTPVLYLTVVMLAETWLSRLCLLIKQAAMFYKVQLKRAKGSRNRPGVVQSVPGDLGSQISMTFGT